ncbi:Fe-S cluster assembly scaffold protein NifU [Methanoculleus sp. 7T]|jgi:nitrogen fixation NifU-like protein|uniref:Fe-S cluster assembly scaffold protein NifU n=1 Tax=Methanoculleus sp. 7T TaxID=2937282 RepID=UPI0020BD8E3E|nr:Fe-S cluster assembly scaffold protein NifU [Methanoculleus sp. 7T]MCK8518904.1 Fe-S cluster assembly scaffold protein NifU [Methanoculleus sp. 7T]
MYTEKVMEHIMDPKNVGELPDADGVGEVGSPACGDIMKIYLKIEGDRITDARFRTFGCGAAIASSSMATEMIRGKSLAEAWALSNADVVDALGGLPPVKVHCSVLARDAIRAAINDYRTRRGLEPWEMRCSGCGDGGCGGETGCGSRPENH